MYGIQINDDNVLLFGDFNKSRNKEAYIMKINDQGCVIKKSMDLTTGKFSRTTAPMIISGKVYAADYERKIHVYDIEKEEWE